LKVKSNFEVKGKDLQKYAKRLQKSILRDVLFAALEEAGNVAASEYMTPTASKEAAVGSPTGKNLMVRSGRLIGSVVGNWRFAEVNLPHTVQALAQGKTRSDKSGFESGKKESIRKVSIKGAKFEGTIGTKVPYAAIHEFGGETHPRVTAKSRKFFWAMYFETGEDMWKGMALTDKDSFTVNIPPRPYLQPGAKDAMPDITNMFRRAVDSTFNEARI